MSEESASHPYRATHIRIELEERLPLLLTQSLTKIIDQQRAEYESTPILPAFWQRHVERTGYFSQPTALSVWVLSLYWVLVTFIILMNPRLGLVAAGMIALATSCAAAILINIFSDSKKITLQKPLLFSLLYLVFPLTAFGLWLYEFALIVKGGASHRTTKDVWTHTHQECVVEMEFSRFNTVIEEFSRRHSIVRDHLNTCEHGLATALERVSRYKVEANPLYIETMRIDQAYADIMQKQVEALKPPLAAFKKHFQLVENLSAQYRVVTKFNRQKSSPFPSPQDEETETSIRTLLRTEYESASRTLAVAEAALLDIQRTQETLSASAPDEEESPENVITTIRKTA